MRKRAYLAIVVAAVLTFTSVTPQIAMAAEGRDTSIAQNEEGAATVSAGDEEKLPTPTGVVWGDKWIPQWDHVNETESLYQVQLFKDGELIYDTYGGYDYGRDIDSNNKAKDFLVPLDISENGTYKFQVRSLADRQDEETGFLVSSEWAESEEKVYVRPENGLAEVTTIYWDDSVTGKLCWKGVEGAVAYSLLLYFTPSGGSAEDEEFLAGIPAGHFGVYSGELDTAGSDNYHDISGLIDELGAGKYRIEVIARSGDIGVIHHSNAVSSDYLDTTKPSESIKDLLDAALNGADSGKSYEDILAEIKEDFDMSSLHTAMQTDNEVLDLMRALEAGYIKEKGITVAAPLVSEEAGAYVNAAQITVVGAGLNADDNSLIGLEVSVPDEYEKISSDLYAKSVQLDIRLNNGGVPVHELDTPITITIPVPAGIDLSRLVVLHYFDDGSSETVNLKNNGDGTVTFTVDRFSTFVFAETASEDSGNTGDTETGNTETGNTETGNTETGNTETGNTETGNTETGNTETGNKGNTNASSASGRRTGLWEHVINVDWNAAGNTISAAQQKGEKNAYVLAGTSYSVPKSIIGMLANQDTALILQSGSGLALSISGKDVRKVSSELKIDFSFDKVIPDTVSSKVTDGAILSCAFSLTDKKSLPYKVDVHLSLMPENAGKYASLYYYDEVRRIMRYAGSFQITASGQAMFAVTQGGDYVVVVTEQMHENLPSGSYTVVSGDTLSAIARKNGVRLKDIIAMNPQIANPDRIYPGQKIIMP